MKLVMHWQEGDGYTYAYDMHQPVEYESAEKLLSDFDIALKGAVLKESYDFYFLDISFIVSDFDEYLPDVYTLDEWFERFKC